MITVTESAKSKIHELFAEEGNPDLKLRTFVQGGGCSGMQYGFTFDETQNEDDFEIDAGEIKVTLEVAVIFGAINEYESESPSGSITP